MSDRVEYTRLLKGLSRMLGNSQVRFLGGEGLRSPDLSGIYLDHLKEYNLKRQDQKKRSKERSPLGRLSGKKNPENLR